MVTVQKKEKGKWIPYPTTFYDIDYPKKGAKLFISGEVGLSSTAKDYATFLQMYLNNGELNGKRLLSRTTIQFIMGNQIGNHWGDSGAYYGWPLVFLDKKGQDMDGRGSKGTFEQGGCFNTQYFADPKENYWNTDETNTTGNY